MEFDGERFIPVATQGDIELEHNHRYFLAADLVRDKEVLDIASGEGYGSALMARSASRVTGVDIAAKAIEYANQKYQADNLSYVLGSATDIPLDENSVDVVVSFETIEHLTDHEQMMLEIRRVLRPNGFLVISSPDKKEYSDLTGQTNHFHVRELYLNEFEQLLAKHFKHYSISGQRIAYGSVIASGEPTAEAFVGFRNDDGTPTRTAGVPRPVYFIAIASDHAPPSFPNSSYYAGNPPYQYLIDQFADQDFHHETTRVVADGTIDPEYVNSLNKVRENVSAVTEHKNTLLTEKLSLESANADLTSGLDSANQRADQLQTKVESLAKEKKHLELHLSERQQVASAALEREQAMLQSRSWRVTSPLRASRRTLGPGLFYAARNSLAGGVKSIWAIIPLSNRARRNAKGTLFRSAPFLFSWSSTYQQWYKVQDDAPSLPTYPGPAIIYEQSEPTQPVPLHPDGTTKLDLAARLICFYLPQFHPIAENNEWWGEGFTEWTNVKPAGKHFPEHYQPKQPAELGYYDLLDPSTQRRQVALANLYGIGGFCFYFYWFAGKRLLETPTLNYLNDPSLDLPFCLCWANENWTRRWDGLEQEFLISQKHSPEDDIEFIKHVSQYLQDPRYIKIEGKPVLIVYRPSLLPNARETAQRWRDWCNQNGLGEIFLVCTHSFDHADPTDFGFDAAVEFPPNNSAPPDVTDQVTELNENFEGQIFDWRILLERSYEYVEPAYRLFRGACPSWDNTARRKENSTIFVNNTPARYCAWLRNAIRHATQRPVPDERLVFINAWNEWAEGAYLEPDKKFGYAYLEATRQALVQCSPSVHNEMSASTLLAIVIHAYYLDVFEEILERIYNSQPNPIRLYVTTPARNEDIVRDILTKFGADFRLLVVDNHGRDVLPFLNILPQLKRDNVELLVKVHTKKSTHREDGHIWRSELYKQLLSGAQIQRAIQLLNDDPQLGVIGPNGHVVPMSYYEGSNLKRISTLSYRMGISTAEVSQLSFCAGTMMIARTRTFDALSNLAISSDDFEPESGQVDGTLAHAVERLFSVSAYAMGYKVGDFNMSSTDDYQFADRG